MKIHNVAQGSVDWSILRSGRVCASEMDALVSPLGKIRTGDGVTTYLYKKVAESWTGGPLASLNIWDCEQGHILEEFARPSFTIETGKEVKTVGFISTDDGRAGCSPDGLVGDDCGLEIKCPHIETHIRYLLDGVLPQDYIIQVQGSLFVTGFPRWIFYSYRRKMPPFMLEIKPDPEIQKSIFGAIQDFNTKFDIAFNKLVELNGGQKPKRVQFTNQSNFIPTTEDVLT
ncbi:MAG: YqaJ viral recombinase family protein [Patescibacteria group bacterium]|nr:YqaJ viral recombinase family protein [Patescibacteria group bacterium]